MNHILNQYFQFLIIKKTFSSIVDTFWPLLLHFYDSTSITGFHSSSLLFFLEECSSQIITNEKLCLTIRLMFSPQIMANEKLCLKWNDFQNLVRASFGDLRNDTNFTDVTLACEDQSIKAHKVVLSACSPFFKKLLKTHSHPQPLIYLKGMKSSSLTAIIDFLYLGEANVFQEELDSFLALAEELQLKGFEGNSEVKVPDHQTETFNHTQRGAYVNEKQNIPEGRISDLKFEKEANLFKGTAMMTYQHKPKLNSLIEPSTMAKVESMIEKKLDGYCCTNCGYTSKKKDHMREHVEKHIEGLEYPCDSCDKILRSYHSFRQHISKSCPF